MDLKEDLWVCDFCQSGFNPKKDKFCVKKNCDTGFEANNKGLLCENCVNAGLDLIDEIDFDVSEGDEEEQFRIFKELIKCERDKEFNKVKEKESSKE